jgi:DNA (cytosine-5)-methyltransferase 1
MLKVLDLFSGLGGFSLGLERTGCFKTTAFCDNDKYSRLLLQKHWKGVKIYNDVREINKEQLESDGIQFPDVITGGFPCQPFSVAGKQKGTSDDRHLWPEMFRIIKEFTPRWIIGENVKGLTNIEKGMVFESVCTDLEGEGYEVRAFNIPAAGVGAPHRRERIWIVASLEDSRRSLRSWSKFGEKDENEIRKRYADQHQRPGSTSESDVADASTGRRASQEGEIQTRGNGTEHQGWWSTEPNVGRVANGVSGRVYRLKALGNSIVPQIATEIGYAIIKAEGLWEI